MAPNNATRSVLYWNNGRPRFYDAVKGWWRDLGPMHCKELAREWCDRNGVRFEGATPGVSVPRRPR